MGERGFKELKLGEQTLRVFINDRGTDTAVVLLHGWGANAALYSRIIEQLGEAFTVIAPNLPGFGGSEEPKEAWDVDAFTDCAVSLIDSLARELHFKRVSLIGHSFGGRIIIKMVTRRSLPFEVDKLVLIDSAGIRHANASVSKKTARFKRIKNFWTNSPFAGIAPDFSQKMLEKAKYKFGSADYRAASPRMRECLVKAVNEDLTDLLPLIQKPTLLIWGDRDTATPLEDAELMQKLIPDAGLCVLEGAGHFSYADEPARTARILASYFEL